MADVLYHAVERAQHHVYVENFTFGDSRLIYKLAQARQLLEKGNYEAAEALAGEADKLTVSYSASEDTPKKVKEDIAKAKTANLKPAEACLTSCSCIHLKRV